MSEFPEIFVLRHGQTEWNRVGRHQGRMNSPLTDQGHTQAAAQGTILAEQLARRGGLAYFCSPQGRAFDTAGIALAPLGQVAKTDERLCEISFGRWEGLTFDEIADGWPEHCKHADQDMFGWNFLSPGGESFDDIYRRAKGFLDDLAGPSVLVTHGITSRLLRGIWLGVGADEMAALGGGQGCVYHLRDGEQVCYPEH